LIVLMGNQTKARALIRASRVMRYVAVGFT